MDLGASFFLLLSHSTESFGRGTTKGRLELRVRGHGKGTVRGTLSEVVCFIRRVGASLASFKVGLGTVLTCLLYTSPSPRD